MCWLHFRTRIKLSALFYLQNCSPVLPVIAYLRLQSTHSCKEVSVVEGIYIASHFPATLWLFSSKSFIHFSIGQCVAMSRPTINNFLSKLEYLHTCEFGLYNHFKIFVKTSFYNLPTRVHLQFVLDTQGTFFGLRLYPARVLCLGQKGYNHRLTVPYRVPLSPSL